MMGLTAGTAPADGDGDGMPDAWEGAHGLDPAAADDKTVMPSGYTAIEEYVNELTDMIACGGVTPGDTTGGETSGGETGAETTAGPTTGAPTTGTTGGGTGGGTGEGTADPTGAGSDTMSPATGGETSGGSTGGTSGAATGGTQADGGGCGCRGPGSDGAWWGALGLLALRRRRR
jgi:MYXO-CTERM domain-containing protein